MIWAILLDQFVLAGYRGDPTPTHSRILRTPKAGGSIRTLSIAGSQAVVWRRFGGSLRISAA
jgi:hypothetical protein